MSTSDLVAVDDGIHDADSDDENALWMMLELLIILLLWWWR